MKIIEIQNRIIKYSDDGYLFWVQNGTDNYRCWISKDDVDDYLIDQGSDDEVVKNLEKVFPSIEARIANNQYEVISKEPGIPNGPQIHHISITAKDFGHRDMRD